MPYPARRRAENLSAHKVERDANLLDQYQRDTWRQVLPWGLGR
jgi:hypothetical protein